MIDLLFPIIVLVLFVVFPVVVCVGARIQRRKWQATVLANQAILRKQAMARKDHPAKDDDGPGAIWSSAGYLISWGGKDQSDDRGG